MCWAQEGTSEICTTQEPETVDIFRCHLTNEDGCMEPQLSLPEVNNQLFGLADDESKIAVLAPSNQIFNLSPVLVTQSTSYASTMAVCWWIKKWIAIGIIIQDNLEAALSLRWINTVQVLGNGVSVNSFLVDSIDMMNRRGCFRLQWL